MAQILAINGPNLNLLGQREPDLYGNSTLDQINQQLDHQATGAGHSFQGFQSNGEQAIIERIHSARQEGIDVTLICDNTAGMLMKQGKIDHIIVGADRIAANGDAANKIGTYSVAVLAEKHDVPFYVAAPSSTFDDDIETGDQIVIEERAATEVTHGFGRQTAPEGIGVYSPAFDVTPDALITYYITDSGLRPGGRGV